MYYDPNNIVQSKAFIDAKRKLRLVLSCVSSMPYFNHCEKILLIDEYFESLNNLTQEKSLNAQKENVLVKINSFQQQTTNNNS